MTQKEKRKLQEQKILKRNLLISATLIVLLMILIVFVGSKLNKILQGKCANNTAIESVLTENTE